MSLADYNAVLGSVVLTFIAAAVCVILSAFVWHLIRPR